MKLLGRILDWIRRIHRCPLCGESTPAAILAAWRACADCVGPSLAAQRLEPHREAWVRLVRKHNRYLAAGVRTAATDASLVRVARRLEEEILSWPEGLRPYGYRMAGEWIGIDLGRPAGQAAA